MPWRVRLSADADRDFQEILAWTDSSFGPRQAHVYAALLIETLRELAEGPDHPKSRNGDELRPGVRTLHVARRGRRGRHFILYRTPSDGLIEVVRILHDSMDLVSHLAPEA